MKMAKTRNMMIHSAKMLRIEGTLALAVLNSWLSELLR